MTSETFPFSAAASTKRNNPIAELVELAVRRKEGRLARTGAFVAETGEHTGRSASDKYTLKDALTETVMKGYGRMLWSTYATSSVNVA